jgi:putative ABC transport system permease protein
MKWWQLKNRAADLERELSSDLELEEQEQRERGLPPEEAHYAALRAFGNTTLIKEHTHEAWGRAPFERLSQDLRYASRQLRRSPGFAAAVVGTLTLGIGATTTIFTLVYGTLIRSLPYRDSDRIVRIHDVRLQGQSTGGLVGTPRFYDLVARTKSFESLGFYYFDHPTLIAGTHLPMAMKGVSASAGLWNVLETQPLRGRTFNEQDDQPNAPDVAVLSYSAWQQNFGADLSAIGRQATIDGKSTTIIGVMPQSFHMPAGIDLWRPAQFDQSQWGAYRGDGTRFLNVIARLKKGVSLPAAQSDLQRICEQLQREHPDTDGIWKFSMLSLRNELYGELRPALLVLLIASGFLLLIACINVANLQLTRVTVRRREVALRRALGASEGRIRLQFLTESTVLAFTGACAGLALTCALVRTLATRLPGRLGLPGTIDMYWPVVWFALSLAVAASIVFGLAPALRARGTALNDSLKQGGTHLAGAAGGWARNVFISVQVGASLVLLVASSLLTESLWNLLKSPLGFTPDHALTFRIVLPWNFTPAATRDFFANVQSRLEVLPGVVAVGQATALPTEDWHARNSYDADWLPRTQHRDAINAEVRGISGDYLRALGTPLLSGRALTQDDASAKTTAVLVNRTFAEQYVPGGNPIDKHLIPDAGSMEIVGVISDIRGTAGPIANKVSPEIYLSADGEYPSVMRSFVVRARVPPEQLIASVREQVREVDPQRAISNVSTMDELLDQSVAQPRLNMVLMTAFAAVALLLACVGIYGVIAWSVAQRVQEIGVRMALGATRRRILLLFMRRVVSSTVVGIAAGVCGALLLTRLLRSQLYGVAPGNPWVYVISIILLLVPVLLATLRPSLRAASINPVDALRAE